MAARLGEATVTPQHSFWPDDLSLLERGAIEWSHVLGSRQVTDVYLLALAVGNGGRFVTLDRSVPLAAAPGTEDRHLAVI